MDRFGTGLKPHLPTRWRFDLRQIGEQLAGGVYPRVLIGGAIVPCNLSDHTQQQGTEHYNELPIEDTQGTSLELRTWPSWRLGEAGPKLPSHRTTSDECRALRDFYVADVEEVIAAYPGTSVTWLKQGMWLKFESQILREFSERATFLVGVPFDPALKVRAWGFWSTVISAHWIGPRHTNYFDGSICAFHTDDNSWAHGHSLVKLFDMYSLWACRHLHLRVFGDWPGHQHSSLAIERLAEYHDDELCGCETPSGLYKDCCKPNDILIGPACSIENLAQALNYASRKIPKSIVEYMNYHRGLPCFSLIEQATLAERA